MLFCRCIFVSAGTFWIHTWANRRSGAVILEFWDWDSVPVCPIPLYGHIERTARLSQQTIPWLWRNSCWYVIYKDICIHAATHLHRHSFLKWHHILNTMFLLRILFILWMEMLLWLDVVKRSDAVIFFTLLFLQSEKCIHDDVFMIKSNLDRKTKQNKPNP